MKDSFITKPSKLDLQRPPRPPRLHIRTSRDESLDLIWCTSQNSFIIFSDEATFFSNICLLMLSEHPSSSDLGQLNGKVLPSPRTGLTNDKLFPPSTRHCCQTFSASCPPVHQIIPPSESQRQEKLSMTFPYVCMRPPGNPGAAHLSFSLPPHFTADIRQAISFSLSHTL
jgi:hypothetical protein